jgi:hypothetical protein
VEGDDEHSTPALGHSEVARIQYPEGPPIAEFAQATEERPKVPAGMGREEPRDVLEEYGGRSVSLHKVEEGEGEPGSGSVVAGSHASSLPGDAEILAGESAAPEGGSSPVTTPKR